MTRSIDHNLDASSPRSQKHDGHAAHNKTHPTTEFIQSGGSASTEEGHCKQYRKHGKRLPSHESSSKTIDDRVDLIQRLLVEERAKLVTNQEWAKIGCS